MSTMVIYHADCLDGFCAAWIANQAYQPDDPPIFVAAKYGDDPPDVDGLHVYILDFSYPRETLVAMNGKASKLHVFDHHKTAQKNLDGLEFCTFDMNRSGAGLALDFFGLAHSSKWVSDAVEDRDLWRFSLPYSEEICLAIGSVPRTFEAWTLFGIRGREVAIESGKAIKGFRDQQVDQALRNSYTGKISGFTVPIVNAQHFQSEIGHALLAKFPDAPFVAIWYIAEGKIVHSLRSADNREDVSEIAKLNGGGGHRNAAGFTTVCDTTP
jgi:uncharacterized protein